MTDEQIFELVKEHFKEGGVHDDGSCSEWWGETDAFVKFATTMYYKGWYECMKCRGTTDD